MRDRLPTIFRLQRLTRRGTVLVAIVSLHVLAAVGFSAVRHVALPVAAAEPIDVVLTQDTDAQRPPEPLPTRLAEVLPDIRMPDIVFAAEVPAPAAITVPVAAPAAIPVSTEGAATGPVDISEVDYLRPPAPRYPPSAKKARAQGIVFLLVLIDTEGHARDVRVHRTSGFELLDLAARDAVLAALFKPHRENGVARNARVIVPIQFSLTIRTASAS
ncbi:MAG: TonB family protein [Pseudomonadota bacterium]